MICGRLVSLGLLGTLWVLGPPRAAHGAPPAFGQSPVSATWVDRRSSPDLFLKPLRLRLRGTRQTPLPQLNRTWPLNPVAPLAEIFTRKPGPDVMNAIIVERAGDRVLVTLREQGRTPLAERKARGLPGGRSFTMSESFGGSLEAKGGRVELVEDNIRHEAAEELHVDARTFRTRRLFANVAISPDRSTGVAHGMMLETTTPLYIDNANLQDAASGETAETGARALSRVPLSRAIRYTQTGQIVDGRTKLLLLLAALELKAPLDPALSEPPSAAERGRLARDFDPERSDVSAGEYSRVALARSANPATEEYRSGLMRIASRRVSFSSADGRRAITDRFEHKSAIYPDQVSELPVVRTSDGQLHVGLVPTVTPGTAGRAIELDGYKIAKDDATPPSVVQHLGLLRDVSGYRPTMGRRGGNLGVEPVYQAAIADAHARLGTLGLLATRRTTNLGQLNASVGENGFHINLMVREFELARGASLPAEGQIRFVSLPEALRLIRTRPHEFDQTTQLQILELALRNRVGFRFAKSER